MASIESSKMMIAAKIMTPTSTTCNGAGDGVCGVVLGSCSVRACVGVGVALCDGVGFTVGVGADDPICAEFDVSVCAGFAVALGVGVAVGVGADDPVCAEVDVSVFAGFAVALGVGVGVCVSVLIAKVAVNEPLAETALNW